MSVDETPSFGADAIAIGFLVAIRVARLSVTDLHCVRLRMILAELCI